MSKGFFDSSNYPPAVSAEEQNHIVTRTEQWALQNGLTVLAEAKGRQAKAAPVTLFPTPWPKVCWEQALALQEAYNYLYAAIAHDAQWLGEVVKELIRVDAFIARLWNVHLKVQAEGYAQHQSLGIFRSDYMLHGTDDPQIKQVEFNTVASSFAGLAHKATRLHQRLAAEGAYPASTWPHIGEESLPRNDSSNLLGWGLAATYESYIPSAQPSRPLCVLFVVQDGETNVFDQLPIADVFLKSSSSGKVFRITSERVSQQTRIEDTSDKRPLLFRALHEPDQEYEVAIVYFRSLYSPAEFSEEIWETRFQLERSGAIKCPSILAHVAGSKKIQQILATPGSQHLEKFLRGTEHESSIDRIRASFTNMYPLDQSDVGQEAIAIAENEERCLGYVLKPQREGGGNNIYGAQIAHFLRDTLKHDRAKYGAFILMELIQPPPMNNYILRDGQVREGPVVGELGFYGTCLWERSPADPSKPLIRLNGEAGFLLRTKAQGSNEGGVAAGFGSIDSPCLM